MKKWRFIPLLLAFLLLVSCKDVKSAGGKNEDILTYAGEYHGEEACGWFPETRTGFMRLVDGMVTVTVHKTEIRKMQIGRCGNYWDNRRVATVLVKDSLWGGFRRGQYVRIVESPDALKDAFNGVQNTFGNLQEGSTYLLFLSSSRCTAGDVYCVCAKGGQFEVDRQGNIQKRDEWADKLWKEVRTVKDVEIILHSQDFEPYKKG